MAPPAGGAEPFLPGDIDGPGADIMDGPEQEAAEEEPLVEDTGAPSVPRKGTGAWYFFKRNEPVVPGSDVTGERLVAAKSDCWRYSLSTQRAMFCL